MSMPPPPPGGSFPQPPPGWQPSQTPQQPPVGAAPGRTSGLAIASMVLGIVWVYWIGSILAIIFGHVAISQIRRDPTLRGKGMAIAGVVLGYVGIGIFVLGILVFAATRSTN
jgi:hypothetical protein